MMIKTSARPITNTHPGRRQGDVWSTMSSGSTPLHPLSGTGPRVGHNAAPPGQRAGVAVAEEYLEPTPPRPTAPIEHSQRRAGYKPRVLHEHDSGVADVDGLHVSVDSNMNGIGPRTSGEAPLLQTIGTRERMRRPESLAVKGHEYEELPASRYQAQYQYPDMDEGPAAGSGGSGGRRLPPALIKLQQTPLPPNSDSNENLVRPISGTSSNGGAPSDRTTYRKRENPLYEESDPDDLELKRNRSGSFFACPCLGVLLVGLLALVAFLLALFIILGPLRSKQEVTLSPQTAALVEQLNQSQLLSALANMKELEIKYNRLLEKYTILESIVGEKLADNGTVSSRLETNTLALAELLGNRSQDRHTFKSLTDKVERLNRIDGRQNDSVSQLNSNVESLQRKYHQLNASLKQEVESLRQDTQTFTSQINVIDGNFNQLQTDVQTQLGDVRKMPGPRGPPGPRGLPGVGNLTQCRYYFQKRGGSADADATLTGWWPSTDSDVQAWVIMGAECSTEGGSTALLQYRDHSGHPGVVQFQCMCQGQMGNPTSRYCRLNMWMCPRIS